MFFKSPLRAKAKRGCSRGNQAVFCDPQVADSIDVVVYEAVAEYEPQVAAQWALTLPAGEARQRTLLRIYQNWPKADAAAAAAFAKEQGLLSDSAR